jgi:hypothetical protein
VPVAWEYSGFHAFFQVTVGMTWFVRRSGDVAGDTLVADGPADCCDPPSGGFDYSGATTFPDLQPGDVYGFRMTGSNDDSDPALRGTLVLQEVDGSPPSITPIVTAQAGSGGFYTGPSTVKWTVPDDGSRVTSTTG